MIARGDPDAFDSHMIFYHSYPLAVGDEWWVYYVGFNEGHTARSCYDEAMRQQYHADVKAGRRHFPAIGLAKVRREGFISRDAGGGRRHPDDAAAATGREPAGGERGGGGWWVADGGGAGRAGGGAAGVWRGGLHPGDGRCAATRGGVGGSAG